MSVVAVSTSPTRAILRPRPTEPATTQARRARQATCLVVVRDGRRSGCDCWPQPVLQRSDPRPVNSSASVQIQWVNSGYGTFVKARETARRLQANNAKSLIHLGAILTEEHVKAPFLAGNPFGT